MNHVTEISGCEVCGNDKLEPVLNLGSHPMCDDLVTLDEIRTCHEYPIEILFCSTCATAHQRFQVHKRKLFPKTYHYRSRFTGDVLKGMSSLVDACEAHLPTLKNKIVLDIGCNDGSLLDFFQQKGCKTIGIEPTNALIDAEKKGHCLYNDFLSLETAEMILKNNGQPDVITFTNVFAHIENLKEVINAVKLLMSPQTMVVIENHYLGSVLKYNQFDTFYHEHPRNYSLTSFIEIAKNLNAEILDVEFPARYGGNIRVFLRNSKSLEKSIFNNEEILKEEKNFLEKFELLRNNISKWQESKREYLNQLIKKYKKIPAKGFPGRAAILIKMLGINEEIISCVYEKPNSMKIGNYIPGTRIPIKSDDVLFSCQDKHEIILNLAWHISDEIKEYLTLNGFKGKVIDILSPEDFY